MCSVSWYYSRPNVFTTLFSVLQLIVTSKRSYFNHFDMRFTISIPNVAINCVMLQHPQVTDFVGIDAYDNKGKFGM